MVGLGNVAEVMTVNNRRALSVMLAALVLILAVLSGAVVADEHAGGSPDTPTKADENELVDDTSTGGGSASDDGTVENDFESDSGDGNETATREADVAITQSK